MNPTRPNFKHLTFGLLLIALLNMAASYGREIVVAWFFGTGSVADSFMASYAMLLTMNDLFMGAILTASVVPVFATLTNDRQDKESWQSLLTSLTLAVTLVTFAAAGTVYQFYPQLVALLFPGFNAISATLAVTLGRAMVGLIPLQALLLLFCLTLNTRHRYLFPALGYLIINLSFSLLTLWLGSTLREEALPVAVITGNAFAVFLLAAILWRSKAFAYKLSTSGLKQIWKLGRIMLFSLGLGSSMGLLMASHLLIRHHATYLGEGSLAALSFAFRIYEVPLTILATTAATLVLPVFSRFHAAQDTTRMADHCRQLISWGWLALLPFSVVVFLYAKPVVFFLLERGEFDPSSTALTALALQGFAPAIIVEAGFVVFFRVFYALHQPQIPAKAGVTTLAILAGLLYLLPLADVRSIAFCLSAAFAFTSLYLLISVRHLLGADILPPLKIWLLPLFAALALGWLWQAMLPTVSSIMMAAMFGILYVLCYGLCLLPFLPEERRQLVQFLKRRDDAKIS